MIPSEPASRSNSSLTNAQLALGMAGPYAHWWITAVVMLGFTTAGLSVTVVNLAFPKIMSSLRADLDTMQWVQTGYMIMQAVMMPSVGWLGARLGNRRLYLLALGVFVGGSVLCGLAWDIYSLIGFRLIQAIGAGPLFPISQVILFQAFPENKRGLAMGISSLGFSFGPMVGPVLGGYLLDVTTWRSVFFINVPVGIVALGLAFLVLPQPMRPESRRLDIVGMLTLAVFLVSFLLAMSQGRTEGWDSPYILTLLGMAALAGTSFVIAELHNPQPFVELRLYRHFAFAMASLVVFLNTLSFMATNFVVTLFLQMQLDFTPLQSAWMMMPAAVVIGTLSVFSGRLSDIVSPKVLIIFGLVLVSWCIMQYAAITAWTSIGMITFWLTARGFARAFTIAPLSAASLKTLPETQVRMGSGLLSLNRGIASASSVALAATLFQNRLAERAILLAQDQSLASSGRDDLLATLTTMFLRLGDLSQLAQTKAMATAQRLLTSEAALHSYHDTFMIIASLSAVGILPALWMHARRQTEPAPAAIDSSPEPSESTSPVTPSPTVAHANGASQPAARMAAVSTNASAHRTAS
ncbi:DHA2 family efflux MFS transporter permease subunit [Candidatus Entotheonella palauensis]|uniref:DHA2 family efflux MFS transporter permease subunit n=1 Tax=Candidatus Entotheonella palauensis TaxID=93172 RepID=UPI0004B74B6B|nr:DHA2 family efflux MFS transporter permease subunit [Candidatus Entotheonella palauensis]